MKLETSSLLRHSAPIALAGALTMPKLAEGAENYSSLSKKNMPALAEVSEFRTLRRPSVYISTSHEEQNAAPTRSFAQSEKPMLSRSEVTKQSQISLIPFAILSAIPLLVRIWKNQTQLNPTSLTLSFLNGATLSLGILCVEGASSGFFLNAIGALNAALFFIAGQRKVFSSPSLLGASFRLPRFSDLKPRERTCFILAVSSLILWGTSRSSLFSPLVPQQMLNAFSIYFSTSAMAIGFLPQIFDLYKKDAPVLQGDRRTTIWESISNGFPWHVFSVLRGIVTVQSWLAVNTASFYEVTSAVSHSILFCFLASMSLGVFYRDQWKGKVMIGMKEERGRVTA